MLDRLRRGEVFHNFKCNVIGTYYASCRVRIRYVRGTIYRSIGCVWILINFKCIEENEDDRPIYATGGRRATLSCEKNSTYFILYIYIYYYYSYTRGEMYCIALTHRSFFFQSQPTLTETHTIPCV